MVRRFLWVLPLLVLAGSDPLPAQEDPSGGPTQSTCKRRCGDLAPIGCSCRSDCGYQGNCCQDVRTYCGHPDLDDAFTFSAYLSPESAATRLTPADSAPRSDPIRDERFIATTHDQVFGLTRVSLGDIDDRGEHAYCQVYKSSDGQTGAIESWILRAAAWTDESNDEAFADCAAGAIRAAGAGVRAVHGADAHNGGTRTVNMGAVRKKRDGSPNEYPVLLLHEGEDTDGREDSGCRIHRTGDNWFLEARSQGDADAWCQAGIMNFGSSGMRVSGTYGVYLDPAGGGAVRKAVTMGREGEHSCFLTQTQFANAVAAESAPYCKIYSKNGDWLLEGYADSSPAARTACAAVCFEIPNPFPPVPANVARGSAGGGARFYTYQTGPYDRPFVFSEGFDPENKLSAPSYVRAMGPLFRRLQRVGFDVTVVDNADAGGDVTVSARETAEAISYAYHFRDWGSEERGKRFPVTGVSMGGVTTKIALASWEEGRYQSGGPEPIGGPWAITTSSPPVSAWISIAGPHGGAYIPRSLQSFVQNTGWGLNARTEGFFALNSRAAEQMLNIHVPLAGCTGQIFWETCTLLNLHTLKKGYKEATGYECPADSTVRDAFYQEIDARGIGPRNGYPQTIPLKVGLINGSWYRQSCVRLPDGGSCDGGIGTLDSEGRPVPGSSFWGKLSFEDSGHTFLSLCDRSTQVWFQINNQEELMPGDLSGRGPSNLEVVGLPKQVTEFDVRFFLPFMHHRVDQDLGCPLAYPGADGWESPADAALSNDAACQATNRTNARFHWVHSNPMRNLDNGNVYNGSHNALSAVLANRFLAYAFDARPGGDADGWIGSGNPFFNPAIHTPDCDDGHYSLENLCAPHRSLAQ